MFGVTGKVELVNPLRNSGFHQNVSYRNVGFRLPCQGEGSIFRTRVEQGPSFDGARDPPTPKSRETNGHFVPVFADLEKTKCSRGEVGVFALNAGLDDVEKHIRQQLRL